MTGWQTASLGEISTLISRGVAPKYVEDGGIAVLNQKCVRDHTVNTQFARRHDEIAKPVKTDRLVQRGDVLVNSTGTGTLGRVGIVSDAFDEPTTVDTHVTIVRPKPDTFVPKFFGYMMVSIEDQLKAAGVGTSGQTELSRTSIENEFRVSFPTNLAEQQRIVGILDQAFEGIAKAKANAERNLANAKELFESERENLFLEDAEAEERCFDEICDITSTLVDPREAAYQPMLHIGAGNIESESGALSNVQSAAEEKLISGKFIFDESMVLYSKIRPYLKKVVAPEFRGLCSADIYPLTPNKNLIKRDYLYHMLLTKRFTDYAILGSERAGMPKVNRNHLFAYKVAVPAMSRQAEVVGRLQDVRAASENLYANYKARIRAIDELKSSILHQAFSGKL